MKVVFRKPKFRLPHWLRHEICQNIKANNTECYLLSSEGLSYCIHFDVMRRKRDGSMGWYAGYVDTWVVWWQMRKRRRHFVVQVLDYGKEITIPENKNQEDRVND